MNGPPTGGRGAELVLESARTTALLGFAALVLGATLVAACGSGNGTSRSSAEDDRLLVVTTISPIRSIVENVGGDRIEVVGLVPEGANSHTFEPAPSAARRLADADLIVVNGLNLELPTLELARASSDAAIVLLADTVIAPVDYVFDFSFPEGGDPNPHAWTDPRLAIRYAEVARDALRAIDPPGSAYYEANLAAFRERANDLDRRFTDAASTVPENNRRLLTYHDSFPYFAPRYGFEIIGAIEPSDFSEPSPQDVAGLIAQIRELGLPAIFGSEVFDSPVLDRIAEEAGAVQVSTLRDDDLPGEPGDSNNTYFAMMVENVRTIVVSLGGDAGALDGVNVSDTWIRFGEFDASA